MFLNRVDEGALYEKSWVADLPEDSPSFGGRIVVDPALRNGQGGTRYWPHPGRKMTRSDYFLSLGSAAL